MDVIEKLFNAPVRGRLLKLFFMNPDVQFSARDASCQAKVLPRHFLAEARRLIKVGVLKSVRTKILPVDGGRGVARRTAPRPVRTELFSTNSEFPLFSELRNLVVRSAPYAKGQLVGKLRRLGNIKLAVLAGVFIDNPTSRVDLLLVGDGFRKSQMKSLIGRLEAEIGKELKYVAMSPQEFRYRMDMYDRFVQEVLESPHEAVINRMGV